MVKKEYIGFVKWMSKTKGYGFINIENEDRDVFCHCNDCEFNQIYDEGEKIIFEIAEEEKGKRAINVRRFDNE